MNKFRKTIAKALIFLTALIISTGAQAINTKVPGYEDGVTIISKSSELITEKGNYQGLHQWSVAKIDDQLYTLRYLHYQSFFLITSKGVIVSDPNIEKMAKRMVREIKKITNKPIKLVIYSHDHWDHTTGAQAFKNEGAMILAHKSTTESMRDMQARWPTPKALMPDKSWSGDRYVVDLGDADLELRYYGENHGSGMVTFYFPKRKIIHLADIISPNRLPAGAMPDMYPTEILRTLKEIAKLDFDQVISAHEPWVLFPRSAVDDMAEFYADMFENVDKTIVKFGRGVAPWVAVGAMQPNPKYKTWNMYKPWWHIVATRFVIERLLGW